MKAHQNRRFYFEVRVPPPLWPTYIYIGKRRIKSEVLWRICLGTNWELGERIENLKGT
jgi:hypothetical protein